MIQNLVFLTGEDEYRLRERVKVYKEAFGKKFPNGEIESFSADDDWEAFENTVFTPSLFGEKRLVFCDGFWDAEVFEKAEKSDFLEKIESVSDTATVIIIDPKPDKRMKWVKTILAKAKKEAFDPMETDQVIQWVCKYADKKQKSLSLGNAKALVARCGEDLYTLSREMEKLISASEEKDISLELIQTLTLPHPSLQVWDFLGSLSQQNKPKSLQLFRELIESGESVYQILAMIMREIRVHTQLQWGSEQGMSEKQLVETTKLHPFVVKKTLPLSRKFNAVQLEKLYDALYEIDKRIKSGGIVMTTDDTGELELAVEKFIVEM